MLNCGFVRGYIMLDTIMGMVGTITNVTCILIGSCVGSFLGKFIKERYEEQLFCGLGIATLCLGCNAFVNNAGKVGYPVLFIASIAIGSIIGTYLRLNERFNELLDSFKGDGKSKLAEGLSTAIMLFCIGTLSILGPIESRLNGNHTYLFTNATLDLISSCILAAAYGIGIAFAAGVLFIWQGSIYMFAGVIAPYMTPTLMAEVSVLGGIFLVASGLGILHLKDCKTLNMLPALFVPPIFYVIVNLFK